MLMKVSEMMTDGTVKEICDREGERWNNTLVPVLPCVCTSTRVAIIWTSLTVDNVHVHESVPLTQPPCSEPVSSNTVHCNCDSH